MRGGVQLAIKNILMKTTPFLYRALLTGVAIFGNLTVSEAQTPKPPLASRITPSNKTAVPVSIDRQFKRDAARLALRLELEREDARTLPAAISRENLTGIHKALTAIYTNDETGKSLARCNIHTFPNPSIDHLVVIYKRNADWAAPLRQGITETTNKTFNNLLDQYDLVIEKHVQWNDAQDALTIRSKEPMNMAALATAFEQIPGIVQIDLGLPKFGGNDIKARRLTGGWEIEFVLQFGATNATKSHSWKYKVTDSGNVSLLKEAGDPLPAWMRCDSEPKNLLSRG